MLSFEALVQVGLCSAALDLPLVLPLHVLPLVRLPAGYSPNQVAYHLIRQVGDFQHVLDSPERHAAVLHEALLTALVLRTAYASANRRGICLAVPDVTDYLEGRAD